MPLMTKRRRRSARRVAQSCLGVPADAKRRMIDTNRRGCSHKLLACAGIAVVPLLALVGKAPAAVTTYNFDVDGANPGFGVVTGATYNWDDITNGGFWSNNVDTTGSSATVPWTQGQFPKFQPTGTPTYTVTIPDGVTESIAGMFASTAQTLTIKPAGTTGALDLVSGLQGILGGTNVDLTIAAPITGAGRPQFTNGGNIRLNAANTYTGGTNLASTATLVHFNNASAFSTGDINMGIAGFAPLLASGGATITLANNFTSSVNGAGINWAADANTPVVLNGTITLGANNTVIRNNGTATGTGSALTLNGVISGSGNVAFSGNNSGVINVNGNNTFSGGVTVNPTSGLTVNALLPTSLGSGTGPLVVSNLNTTTAGKTVTLKLSSSGPTTMGSLSGTISTPTSGTNNVTINNNGQTLTINQTVDGSFAGKMTGNGGFTLGNLSSAVLTLGGANSYVGDTTVTAGTLKYGVAGAIPSGSGKGNVTLNGTLDVNGFNSTINGLSGAGTVTNGGSTSTLSAGANDQTSTFSGAITNAVALTKVGTGTLTLTGANTYFGGTTVSAGTLAGTTSSLQGAISNNANLTFDQSTDASFDGSTITGTGSITKSGSGTVTMTNLPATTGGTKVTAGKLVLSRLNEANPVNITGGTLEVADSSPTLPSIPAGNNAFVSRPSSLTIANDAGPLGSRVYAGTLDLGNNDLIIDYPDAGPNPAVDIEDAVRSGFNASGANWTGTGITSSTAANIAASGNYALAVADNAQLTNKFGDGTGGKPQFDGQNVDDSTVIVKFTHRVDLDLDGFVTPNDAIIFATNYIQNGNGNWITGDVDYDGKHTQNDAIIFATFYNGTLPSLPEPGALGVLGLCTLGLVRRSRSRRLR